MFQHNEFLLLVQLNNLTALTFSLIFMNIQIKHKNIICISDHAVKGLYIRFSLVSS